MDLIAYAELAVLLLNGADRLESPDGLRLLLDEAGHGVPAAHADHAEHGGGTDHAGQADLEALRELRGELLGVFEAADAGDERRCVARLNALLVRHPVRPQISGHDGEPWHLHLTDDGGVADRFAAGCVMGLAALATDLGVDRLGLCRSAPCRRAFLDTSSNRSRRYCSDRCASRANVAAYRARKRQVPAAR